MTLRLRIFIFNLLTVTAAFCLIILMGYKILESTVIENTYEKLSLIRIQKTKVLENYFRDMITALDLIGTNQTVLSRLSNQNHTDRDLQSIDNFARSLNVHDLLIIDANGKVVYTTSKEIESGQIVSQKGPYLGKIPDLFKWSQKASRESFLLFDFDFDDSKAGYAIGYLASPIFNANKNIGALVFRLSLNQIDQITSDNYAWSSHGLGKTGEVLIYGEDWSLRNTSRFVIEQSTEVEHLKNASALGTNRGNEDFNKLNEFDEIQERGLDFRGQPVFRSLGKLTLPSGDSWYIQVKMDESEAFSLFKKLLIAATTAAFIVTIIFFLLSYAATRQVIQPIMLLIERLGRLGQDNLSQKIHYKSKDEIGMLVNKYNELAERLERTTVSKEFVDNVIASMKEYIFIVKIDKSESSNNPAYEIIQANQAAIEALSITGFMLKNKDLRELLVTIADFDNYLWLLENKKSVEADLLTPNGKRIPVLVNWSNLPSSKPNELTLVFACTDITETRANEVALIQARESAVNASMAKSEFLARMSHEIRTPLNAIIGITDLLKESSADLEQKNMLQISANAGENLLALINDILDLSKIEARQVTIENIPFSLSEIIKNVCDILAQKAKDKNLSLNIVHTIDESNRVIGDPTRIRQVLFNLIGNAIKFTEVGAITIEVIQKGDIYTFNIKDTGLGIPDEKRHLIFKNFSQADSSITRKFGGTGLGLAISKNLIELMGGAIDFISSNSGTTFFFNLYLPVSNDSSVQTTNKLISKSIPGILTDKTLSILLVDDTEDNRFLIKAYLKNINAKVIEAANGEEALHEFKKIKFDLVFMDVQMPIMDGYAATRKIREYEFEQGLPPTVIVALSANALPEDFESAKQAGCSDYLPKPIKKAVLYSFLEKYTKVSQ